MATSAILGSLLSFINPSIHGNVQKAGQGFQQLGKDLQSGNLSASQQDFASLLQDAPQSASASQSGNPISQAFNQLGKDLTSGNMSAAVQDYSTIQQDFQDRTQSSSGGASVAHHHHQGAGTEMSQLFSQLGQDLQSGNMSAAQQLYATMQRDFQQFGQSASPSSTWQSAQPSTGSISFSA